MKKLLALLTVLALMLSFTACSLIPTQDTNNDDASKENAKDQLDNLLSQTELAEYYAEYFKGDAKFAGDSMFIKTDGMEMSVIAAKNNEALFNFTVGDNAFEVFKATDGKQYLHAKLSVEGESTDEWFLCEIDNDSENKDLVNSLSDDSTDFTINEDDIVSVKYDKTEDGIDYVTVKAVNTDEDKDEDEEDEDEDKEAVSDSAPATLTYLFGIDSKTHEIKTLTLTEDGIEMTVEFKDVEDIDITIPENVNTATEEDVMGVYMTLIFLSMANSMGG